MRIENIELFYLSMPEILDEVDGSQDSLIVKVEGGGLTGWGECETSPLTSIAIANLDSDVEILIETAKTAPSIKATSDETEIINQTKYAAGYKSNQQDRVTSQKSRFFKIFKSNPSL